MDIVLIGGNNHRAKMQALMIEIVASGINCICSDDENAKAVELRADKYEVKNLEVLRAKDFVIDKPNRPEFKRGKGKVKRWP